MKTLRTITLASILFTLSTEQMDCRGDEDNSGDNAPSGDNTTPVDNSPEARRERYDKRMEDAKRAKILKDNAPSQTPSPRQSDHPSSKAPSHQPTLGDPGQSPRDNKNPKKPSTDTAGAKAEKVDFAYKKLDNEFEEFDAPSRDKNSRNPSDPKDRKTLSPQEQEKLIKNANPRELYSAISRISEVAELRPEQEQALRNITLEIKAHINNGRSLDEAIRMATKRNRLFDQKEDSLFGDPDTFFTEKQMTKLRELAKKNLDDYGISAKKTKQSDPTDRDIENAFSFLKFFLELLCALAK